MKTPKPLPPCPTCARRRDPYRIPLKTAAAIGAAVSITGLSVVGLIAWGIVTVLSGR